MPRASVYLAQSAQDYEAAKDLSLQWLDWHWENYPADWPVEDDHPMAREPFKAMVEDLPTIHARPAGGMIIGSVDGQPAGCVMYRDAGNGAAEFNRLFVNERGRGKGLGRQMLEFMFGQMIEDGYRRVYFSSAVFLTHARAMYEAAGFTEMPHPDGFPAKLRHRVYFMERDLIQ